MKLKFEPAGSGPEKVDLNGEVVNGFDLSSLPEGASFIGNTKTAEAGIRDVQRRNGVLYVTLGQVCTSYECRQTGYSHSWEASPNWVDAEEYKPDECYVIAGSAPPGAEYVRRPNGWTVVMPIEEEEPAT